MPVPHLTFGVLRRSDGEDESDDETTPASLTVDGDEVSSADITRHSAYKRRLNTIITEEARNAGFAPNQVRTELVAMADDTTATRGFDTLREAVQAAVIRLQVNRALGDVAQDKLSKKLILERLTKEFRGTDRLHRASRNPAFAEALLEMIRSKQSETWKKATTIEQVKTATWTNDEMKHWNLRHYTSKFTAVLGRELADGIFEIAAVQPPPFKELLSSITLATMPDTGSTATAPAPRRGSTMLLTYTSGASQSGHTTGKDWQNIGNVGDAFYGLFYGDQPATGVTPNFIRDAVYYAKWPASEFGEGWASADWLATAAESTTEGGKTPDDKPRKGQLTDIIADIFPEASTRVLKDGKESETDRGSREAAFKKMDNFEVKQHGPRQVDRWISVGDTAIATIKTWWVNGATGRIYKKALMLPPAAFAALPAQVRAEYGR